MGRRISKISSLVMIAAMILGICNFGARPASAEDANHALQIVGAGNWNSFWVNVGVIPKNSSFTGSFWMKGDGQVTLFVKTDDFSTEIKSQQFTATDTWTQYTMGPFNTGDNSYLIYGFTDSSSQGTVLIDNAFFGNDLTGNMLDDATHNSDFESGETNWNNDVASIFSVVPVDGAAPGDEVQPPPEVGTQGFIDDLNDNSLMSGDSGNLGFDDSNQANFNGDEKRLSRGSDYQAGDPVYAEYHTDYDIHSVSVSMYYWNDQPVRDIDVSVSANGTDYTPVQLDPFDAGGSWKNVIYSQYTMPISGARYLRVALPDLQEGEQVWTPQMSQINVNLSTAPVKASPDSSMLDGPTSVTLTSETPDAVIHYHTSDDATDKVYDSDHPIAVPGHMQIFAYATSDGNKPSYQTTFNYYTENDLQIDKYGQVISADFPTKVTDDQQLQDDVAADEAYYGSLTPPERDEYGGLPGSKEKYDLEQKPYFNIQKIGDKFVMVDPLGNLYFSVGVNGTGYAGDTFTDIQGREYMYDGLPDPTGEYATAYLNGNPSYFSYYVANRIKKSDGQPFNDVDFYNESVDRLKKWGFTSEGGFSNPAPSDQITSMFPQYKFVDLPTQDMIGDSGLLDVYKTGVADDLDQSIVAADVPERVNDPWIVGYFFGNEIQYQKLKSVVASADPSVASKLKLVDMLQEKYGTIDAFNTAWETDYASFDDLKSQTLVITTEAAGDDMNAFMAQYLDDYYHMLQTEFRKYDTNHMLMGDRYLVNTMNDKDVRDMLSVAAGKYMDVITYNYYTYDLDMDRITSMAKLANKPLLFTEFHYGEATEGLGGGIRAVDNEEQKGLAYRNYVEQAAASGVVVGAHWFEYLDEAATGRWFSGYNGENYGIGLVNVADRPYKTMLDSVMATNYDIYDVEMGTKAPYSYDFGPGKSERSNNNTAEIVKTATPMVIDGVKDAGWPAGKSIELDDKDRVLGNQDLNTSANIDLAWDDDNLYVYGHMNDATPGQNAYTGFDIWNGDAIEMFVGPDKLDQPGALKVTDSQIILSGTGDYYWYNNKQTQPDIQTAVKLDEDGKGYSIEAAIPLAGLNIKDAADGRQLRFDIGFDNGASNQRVAQYLWNGGDDDSSSRDKWGMVTLVNTPSTDNPGNPSNPGNNHNPGSSATSETPANGEDVDVAAGEVQLSQPALDTASGEAAASVSADALNSIFAKSGKAIVNVPEVAGAKAYAVGVPGEFLHAKDDSQTLVIHTPQGSVSLPANMLADLDLDEAATVTLVIAATDAAGLSDEAKALVDGKPVVDLSLRVNGQTMSWNNPNAPVTVSIPYVPTANEAARTDLLTALYIDGEGHASPVPSGRYDAAGKSVVFTAAHFSTYAVAYVPSDFEDLTRYDWAKQAIEALAAKGIITGVAPHQFAPASSITRADFIVLLTKTLGLTAQGTSTFDDVPAGSYYAEAVGAAQALGLVQGVGKNQFNPDVAVSRQDMMVLATRALELAGKLNLQADASALDAFQDGGNVAGYAKASAATLVAADLIHGANGQLNPQGMTTRAEAAVFLSQIYRLIYA